MIINGYLLSLSALFAFGGRLADIAGHRRMVVLGVIVFATASGLCGATPAGSLDEVWLITFRIIQGAGAAIMFPAALAIVLGAFPVRERGRAMAIFFAGFATASQWGGRILDRVGARQSVVLGCAVAAAGFALLAHSLPDLSISSQWCWIVLAGAGVGLVLGPANTDALNRLPASHYGEATGITQTVRNFGSSLGLAVLGTILILENKANLESTLGAQACRRRRPTRSPTRSARAARAAVPASPKRRAGTRSSSSPPSSTTSPSLRAPSST